MRFNDTSKVITIRSIGLLCLTFLLLAKVYRRVVFDSKSIIHIVKTMLAVVFSTGLWNLQSHLIEFNKIWDNQDE